MASPADLRILESRPTLQGPGDRNALENLIVDKVPNGAVCYVVSQADWFVLDKFSLAAVAPPNVIATGRGASRPGRWSRYAGSSLNTLNVLDNYWQLGANAYPLNAHLYAWQYQVGLDAGTEAAGYITWSQLAFGAHD